MNTKTARVDSFSRNAVIKAKMGTVDGGGGLYIFNYILEYPWEVAPLLLCVVIK